MGDTRESLGEFESSIFDASNGHILVDLIRRKKGIRGQAQKIFDDVSSQRPSLHIEIQRLDQENEKNLQPNKHPQEATRDATIVNYSEVPPPDTEFVPKSPVRKSGPVRRSMTSPIIKMNSTKLGRRTLLKEFERAILHESRFNPEICSTPITSDSDLPNQIIHENAKARASEKESPQENIICTPITISDEGSPADQTLKDISRTESVMRSLINQNELLNALVQQSHEDPGDTLVNRNSPEKRSPRRTFTVQCDVSRGKIFLSPAKSGQKTQNDQKTPTKKLISNSKQRKFLSKLGLNLGSPQKSSTISILSKETNANAIVQPACLTNQDSTTTAEFVERLQNNAAPNCPVIVIPVNQTFNQAPLTNRKISNDMSRLEIDSPPPKAMDYASIQKETHREPNRVDSPVFNGISSTTFSNIEQQRTREALEPPIINLRWDDILTDDSSSPEKRGTRKPASKIDRRKISQSKNSQTQQSITNEKKKLSLSYKCLDLRMRVDKDEECEKNLPQKFQQMPSKKDERRRTEDTNNLHQRSHRRTSRNGEQYYEELGDNLPINRQSNEVSKASGKCNKEHKNYLKKQPQLDLPKRSRGRPSKIAQQSDDDHEQNLAPSSQKTSYGQRQNYLQERSRRRASKKEEEHEPRLVVSKSPEQDHVQNSPLRTRRQDALNDVQSDNEHESSPRISSSETDEQYDRKLKENTPHQSRRETFQKDKLQRLRTEGSAINDRRSKESESNNLQLLTEENTLNLMEQYDGKYEKNLPQRSGRKTSVNDVQIHEDRENNILQQAACRPSETNKQQSQQRQNILPHRSLAETSKTHEQHEDNHEQQMIHQPSQDNFEVPEKSRKDQNLQEKSHIVEHRSPQRSRRSISRTSKEISQNILPHRSLAETSKTHEQHEDNHEQHMIHQPSQDNFEVPEKSRKDQNLQEKSHIVEHRSPQRSRRSISRTGKEISPLRQSIQGNEIENIPPPDEFRDIDADFQCTNSISYEKDLFDEQSSDRVVLSQDTFKRPSEMINKKKIRKPKTIPKNVKEYLEVNKKLRKTQYLNISKRKLYSKGNSDVDLSEDSVDTNTSESSTVSTKRISHISKNCKQKKKLGRPKKKITKNVESNPKNIAKNKKKGIVEPQTVDELILYRRSSSDSSCDNEKTSKQTNQQITKKTHNKKDKHIASNSSGSSSLGKRSFVPTSDIGRISRKTNESKSKSNHNDPESNPEDITSPPPQLFLSHSKKTTKSKMASKQSNALLTSVVNEEVEGNIEKDTSKSRSKKKISKKNKKKASLETEYIPSTSLLTSEQPEDCGLRRSKRERKSPTAYWCSDSEYKHVNDIYTMLTSRNKLTRNIKTSTDDNLVANTKTVDSCSKKGKNKTKQQSKQKNKTADKPEAMENRDSQLASEMGTSRAISKEKLIIEESIQDTDRNIEQVQNTRLTTIAEDDAEINHKRTTSVSTVHNITSDNTIMPPPKTNVVKKAGKKKTFYTEHDESIADVSSVHVNYLFEQLKNSSINNAKVDRTRLAINSSGQVSLDSPSSTISNKKSYSSNSVGKTKNVSVRMQRLNLNHEGPYDINEKNFDSGFSSEGGMNSISSKKDILFDWLVQMINNGKSPTNNQRGLARFLQPNGFRIANADELTFEEIDGVDFAFYNSPGKKFGYLRFKPGTEKKLSCAKRYQLNFVLLGGKIRMTVDKQTFDMKNGDLITIFIGATYRMRNETDDPALVMTLRQ